MLKIKKSSWIRPGSIISRNGYGGEDQNDPQHWKIGNFSDLRSFLAGEVAILRPRFAQLLKPWVGTFSSQQKKQSLFMPNLKSTFKFLFQPYLYFYPYIPPFPLFFFPFPFFQPL